MLAWQTVEKFSGATEESLKIVGRTMDRELPVLMALVMHMALVMQRRLRLLFDCPLQANADQQLPQHDKPQVTAQGPIEAYP